MWKKMKEIWKKYEQHLKDIWKKLGGGCKVPCGHCNVYRFQYSVLSLNYYWYGGGGEGGKAYSWSWNLSQKYKISIYETNLTINLVSPCLQWLFCWSSASLETRLQACRSTALLEMWMTLGIEWKLLCYDWPLNFVSSQILAKDSFQVKSSLQFGRSTN